MEREGRFTDKGRFVVESHLRTGRPIGELAQAYDMDPGDAPDGMFTLEGRCPPDVP